MNRIHLKRLTNLACIMREAQAFEKQMRKRFHGFDMSRWAYPADKGKTCGTPACLLGHYAARRDVQRCFSITQGGSVVTHGKLISDDLVEQAAEHFGITWDQAHAMFGGDDYTGHNQAKTPAGAAQYVERFIASKS